MANVISQEVAALRAEVRANSEKLDYQSELLEKLVGVPASSSFVEVEDDSPAEPEQEPAPVEEEPKGKGK